METFLVLGNFTQKGIEDIKQIPERTAAAREAIEKAGGKWLGYYLTMGRYDFILLAEGPSASVAATLALAIGSEGNVRTETLRAFTEDEFAAMIAALP
ncbi:MAG: GYD domain-containing protein [Candidatus Promineifilaceae bacterium]